AGGAQGPLPKPVKILIDHWCGVDRQKLTDDQPAYDGYAERAADFAAVAEAERKRHRAEYGGTGRHHDRPEPQAASLVDRVVGAQMLGALRLDGEVDHHGRVFFDDAGQ